MIVSNGEAIASGDRGTCAFDVGKDPSDRGCESEPVHLYGARVQVMPHSNALDFPFFCCPRLSLGGPRFYCLENSND